MKREEILFNHRHKVFTVTNPKSTFIIDTSNGYPVKVTTNVTKHTKWSDIFKGNIMIMPILMVLQITYL